jgi:hypothetical protein
LKGRAPVDEPKQVGTGAVHTPQRLLRLSVLNRKALATIISVSPMMR